MTAETITGAEMARRMGVSSLGPLIADADRAVPRGPNRKQRRAAARKAKR